MRNYCGIVEKEREKERRDWNREEDFEKKGNEEAEMGKHGREKRDREKRKDRQRGRGQK